MSAPRYSSYDEWSPGLVKCENCGTLVVDQEAHARKHGAEAELDDRLAAMFGTLAMLSARLSALEPAQEQNRIIRHLIGDEDGERP